MALWQNGIMVPEWPMAPPLHISSHSLTFYDRLGLNGWSKGGEKLIGHVWGGPVVGTTNTHIRVLHCSGLLSLSSTDCCLHKCCTVPCQTQPPTQRIPTIALRTPPLRYRINICLLGQGRASWESQFGWCWPAPSAQRPGCPPPVYAKCASFCLRMLISCIFKLWHVCRNDRPILLM